MTILDKFNLKDRVAIVTGGGGQLGFEFCTARAEAGAAVVVADLNMELTTKTATRRHCCRKSEMELCELWSSPAS